MGFWHNCHFACIFVKKACYEVTVGCAGDCCNEKRHANSGEYCGSLLFLLGFSPIYTMTLPLRTDTLFAQATLSFLITAHWNHQDKSTHPKSATIGA
jgi:hypothetical protein